jgi:hypothetical protein
MNSGIRIKLFLMMVLQFFIWGAWLPLVFGYLDALQFSGVEPPTAIRAFVPDFLKVLFTEKAMILNAFPIAAIIGIFFSNQFADRKFAAQKFLGFSHLVGGLAILGCGFASYYFPPLKENPAATSATFWPFFWLMLVHCLLYVPTISVTNAIAFAAMKDAQKEFGIVRMGGTFGWILAAWPFVFIFVDWANVPAFGDVGFTAWIGAVFDHPLKGDAANALTRYTYVAAGIASLLLAALSLFLPHTPPKKATEGAVQKLAWLEAFKLLKHPFILILWLVTFCDAFIHQSYFLWTDGFLTTAVEHGGVGLAKRWSMPVMSIGQIAEISTMFVLAATLKKLGWKVTMVIGILGHAARFLVYSFFAHSAGTIIFVQMLHGICYAFFFATVYIFVDAYFPKDARASAQGLFNVMVLGVGILAANTFGPYIKDKYFTSGTGDAALVNYHGLFLVPCGIALGAAIVLALFFRPPPTPTPVESGGSAPH